ncbi:MAG: hypothetical protein SPE11_09980 [Parabacteroides sp.]|nr:hypothetical protein [Parabacteroides sp.]
MRTMTRIRQSAMMIIATLSAALGLIAIASVLTTSLSVKEIKQHAVLPDQFLYRLILPLSVFHHLLEKVVWNMRRCWGNRDTSHVLNYLFCPIRIRRCLIHHLSLSG